jgi:iron complex outermembrane receptor protein
VTRNGRSAEPVRLRTEGGSFGYLKTFASTGAARGPWEAYLAASDTRSHGFRDHAEQDRQRLYASLGHRFDGGAALRVFVNGVRNRQELPGALTRAEFRDDPSQASPASELQDEARDYDYGRAALALAVPVGDDRSVELYGQLNHQDLWHPLAFGIIDNETTNANGELRFVAAEPLFGLASRLQLGLQGGWTYQPQEIHENRGGSRGPTFESQRANASAAALYAIEELSLSERLALVGGLRFQYAGRELDDRDLMDSVFDARPHDSGSAEFFAVLPSLGLRYALLEDVELYGNVGRSYEPPVLFESTAPGNLNGDLSDLDAQDAWQFELGARGALGDRVRFDVAVYDVEVRDEIRNLNVDPTGQGFFTIPRYVNVDRSRHWGVELFADALLARGVAGRVGLPGDDALHLALAYTFSRFVYVDDPVFGGNDLPGAPRHFVRGELRYAHASGFWIAPNVEWTPRGWFVDSANTERAPAYVLANLRLGYDHAASGLSVFGEVRNLFDRDFVSSVVVDAADGRSYEPGDGRGFFAGVEWRWR